MGWLTVFMKGNPLESSGKWIWKRLNQALLYHKLGLLRTEKVNFNAYSVWAGADQSLFPNGHCSLLLAQLSIQCSWNSPSHRRHASPNTRNISAFTSSTRLRNRVSLDFSLSDVFLSSTTERQFQISSRQASASAESLMNSRWFCWSCWLRSSLRLL